jgi:hypothetical protein
MDNDHASEHDYSLQQAVAQKVSHIEAGYQKRRQRVFYKRIPRGSLPNILYNTAYHNMCMIHKPQSAND